MIILQKGKVTQRPIDTQYDNVYLELLKWMKNINERDSFKWIEALNKR